MMKLSLSLRLFSTFERHHRWRYPRNGPFPKVVTPKLEISGAVRSHFLQLCSTNRSNDEPQKPRAAVTTVSCNLRSSNEIFDDYSIALTNSIQPDASNGSICNNTQMMLTNQDDDSGLIKTMACGEWMTSKLAT